MNNILDKAFFERDTLAVARELVGKLLCVSLSDVEGRTRCYRVTETEAYDGPHDRASHAHRGRTARNAPMFGEAGCWYIYFVYGVHWMLNIVTGDKEYPAAVLIRGVEGFAGPGRVTKALGINKRFNGLPATGETGLWFEDDGEKPGTINALPRVGVAYAGAWAKKPYRFRTRPDSVKPPRGSCRHSSGGRNTIGTSDSGGRRRFRKASGRSSRSRSG